LRADQNRLGLLIALLCVGGGPLGCKETAPPPGYSPVGTARPQTGGRTGSSPGSSAPAGTGGSAGASAAGGMPGMGMAAAGGGGGNGARDASPAESAPEVTTESPPETGAPEVASSNDSGMPEVAVRVDAREDTRREDARVDGTTGADGADAGKRPAACFPDPMVIAICRQLEGACANCPGAALTTQCYAVVEAGDDAACAKFAVDKKCPVDQGGNVCGSLNCGLGVGPPVASGCDRAACATAQGNGDSSKCQAFLAACPCK
jgi:hypothetical protein